MCAHLSFRSYFEANVSVDPTPTAAYLGSATDHGDDTVIDDFNFPNIDAYRQYKIQEDPRKRGWNDMQWNVQYLFDRSQAQAIHRAKRKSTAAPANDNGNTNVNGNGSGGWFRSWLRKKTA